MRCQYYISDFDNYIVALSSFQYLVKYLEAKGIYPQLTLKRFRIKMCMCASVHVCVHVCVHVRACVRMCARVHMCVHASVHVCACTCVWGEIDKANVIKCEYQGE